MYKTAPLDKKVLAAIKVEHQDRIVQATGKPLVPQEAWQIIKKASQDFTIDHEKALEADGLLAQLLEKRGIALPGSADAESIRIREQERKRAIQILKIKLKINA